MIRVLSQIGFILALLICQGAWSAEIKDSGLELANPVTKVIYWVDDKHVIASIFEQEPWVAPDGTKKGVESIYVWNIETGEIKRHAGPGTGGLCVGDGFVRYFIRHLGNGKYDDLDRYYGPLGQERKVVLSGPLDRDTCKLVSELPLIPPWLEEAYKAGRQFIPLQAEHGWVEMSYAKQQNGELDKFKGMHPIRIYTPGNKEGLAVNGLEHADLGSIWPYYPFKGAYLLEEWVRTIPSVTGHVRSWWLYPDGRIEPALQYDRVIRKGEIRWSENRFIPTRTGFLLIYERSYGNSPLANGKTGLYRFQADGNFKKITAGSIGEVEVSPDGCRLALGVDDNYRAGGDRPVLKVIDICKEYRKEGPG